MYAVRGQLEKLTLSPTAEFQTCNTKTLKEQKSELNTRVKHLKDSLKDNIDSVTASGEARQVRPEALHKRNVVSLFDSALTRSLKMLPEELNDTMVIVKVFYFGVAESLIKRGFYLSGRKYVFFSASAGQIRTKKFLCVREDLLKESWNQIAAGLTIEHINELGGVNPNKYLAYLALCNSATDVWQGFDIDRCIVVDDMEVTVTDVVDYIDDRTYEIERKTMDIILEHTDGVGMILPSVSKKNFMIRLPWIKGLLSPFAFDKFITETNENDEDGRDHGIIKDIYGNTYNIIKDRISVIFTKSQFKMWKYYANWDEYKQKFKEFACSANKCNEEETYIPTAKINYQMMQTLTDMTDEELISVSTATRNKIQKMTSDKDTMLKVFGAVERNLHKNDFQEALYLYPELLQDEYTRDVLRELKKSLESDAWSARLDVDGKYLFVIPDLYAFCEHLFAGENNPLGLLRNSEVYCRPYRFSRKLDCLRSPHLYREHAVQNNIACHRSVVDRWFTTDGIYTSCQDLISRLLQNDYDGDKLLVCADETIIAVAERNMQGIVPLYYTMAKAGARELNGDAFYDGMIAAYEGGNIGQISNDITKVWNQGSVKQEDIETIKLLCLEGNFCVDYAKTLYKPTRPGHLDEDIRAKTNVKVPCFFQEAKGKTIGQVAAINSSTVNRLRKLVPRSVLHFDYKNVGRFDYRMLMANPDYEIDSWGIEVISLFTELSSNVNCSVFVDEERNNYSYLFQEIKRTMLYKFQDEEKICDALVHYLFDVKKNKRKVVFWECFGKGVVKNLKANLYGTTVCRECGSRFTRRSAFDEVCDDCDDRLRHPYVDPSTRRTLVCIDCGVTFDVPLRNTKSIRCEKCQKEKVRTTNRETMRLLRAKEKEHLASKTE